MGYLLLILMATAFHCNAEAITNVQGYLVCKLDNYETRCLGHVSDWREGTYNFTGNPWEHDYCDLLVIESYGDSAEAEFTIRLAETGLYLTTEDNFTIQFADKDEIPPTLFTSRIEGDCDKCGRNVGIYGILSSEPDYPVTINLVINDKLHLVDYYYMDVESELYDYGILYAFDVPGLDNWFGSWVWWFVQENSPMETTADEELTSFNESTATMNMNITSMSEITTKELYIEETSSFGQVTELFEPPQSEGCAVCSCSHLFVLILAGFLCLMIEY